MSFLSSASPIQAAFVFLIVWTVCAYVVVRFVWQTFAPFPPSQFSFYITDIWTLNLALLPAFFLMRWLAIQSYALHDEERQYWSVVLVMLVLSQLLFVFVARLHSIPPDGHRMPGRLDQAGWILGGSLMGALFLGASFLVYLLCLLLLLALPCVLAILVPYLLYKAFTLWVRLF